MASSKAAKGTTKTKLNIETPLPVEIDAAMKKHQVKIALKRVDTKFLLDQSRALNGGDGCISNPGGPSC